MTERVWNIVVDSFPKILLPGLTMTIPLTVISFAIAMVIAVACGHGSIRKGAGASGRFAGFTSGSFGARRCWCSCT